MTEIKLKTIVELIDFIFQAKASGDICDEEQLKIYNTHAEELASRLSVSRVSAIIFAYIFWKSVRGDFSTKREVVTDVAKENTKEIFLSFSELIKNNLVKYYKPHPRKPENCYYTLEELDKCIINNNLPFLQNKTATKLLITMHPFENGEDYWVYLNNNKIGVAYHLVTDSSNYSVVVGDEFVLHSNSVDEVLENLNKLLKDNKLKI